MRLFDVTRKKENHRIAKYLLYLAVVIYHCYQFLFYKMRMDTPVSVRHVVEQILILLILKLTHVSGLHSPFENLLSFPQKFLLHLRYLRLVQTQQIVVESKCLLIILDVILRLSI